MARASYGLRRTGRVGDPSLAHRLSAAIDGEVLFDAFSRGRYSTDASHYQIEPIGVVVAANANDVKAVIDIARDEGVPVLPRGGGTSQCGQTVAEAIAVDTSKHLNKILALDVQGQTAQVQPGIVLDALNAQLKPHGLWFPVDVSTASQATIGGMTGNNSCGSRSLRYGTMRDNIAGVDALLADGTSMHFGPVSDNSAMSNLSDAQSGLVSQLLSLGHKNEALIYENFPDLMRRVGGYNVDALLAKGPRRGAWSEQTVHSSEPHPNLAHLLVGSEGTLAFSTAIDLKLQTLPTQKTLGVCHFPRFYDAMSAAQHLVTLGPVAVELVDRTMIRLAREIPMFRDTVNQFVRGDPEALLLVEFSEDDQDENVRRLRQLGEMMADLGFSGGVVEALDSGFQKAIWDVRKSGLNIMMSMKGDGKPLSFIEDCAVRLEDLAEYTDRLTQVFHANNTEGTWYAHASVGCLHVRPILNLKSELGATQLRDIAEQAFALVREYKGSHSGEHGDGLVRSEFHEAMFGPDMVRTFKDVKRSFDSDGLFNPGKIVDPPKMDDRSLFRFKPGYQPVALKTALDWSAWGGWSGAAEMCNNNGACRKADPGVMCPSFRVTGEERHLTRGRANTLRLALSGQLGPDALVSDDMYDTMALCVGCKGCKRECPTGVDMAKMKIEFLHHYHERHGLTVREKLIAYLPRYAPLASKFRGLLHWRDDLPGLAWLSEKLLGFSAHRSFPRWDANPFGEGSERPDPATCEPERTVLLFADTFNSYFEPAILRAAHEVLEAAGYKVVPAGPAPNGKRLCCGRTYLAAGLIDHARREAQQMLDVLLPYAKRGIPIVGLEPSCLLTLRDEFHCLGLGQPATVVSEQALLFEEFLARELDTGKLALRLRPIDAKRALVHGHCHQKAFAAMGPVQRVLGLIPELEVQMIESSCCGMAGAFGYESENYESSMAMAELSLLPALRQHGRGAVVVADGTSCRHQIADGVGQEGFHVAQVLARALEPVPA